MTYQNLTGSNPARIFNVYDHLIQVREEPLGTYTASYAAHKDTYKVHWGGAEKDVVLAYLDDLGKAGIIDNFVCNYPETMIFEVLHPSQEDIAG